MPKAGLVLLGAAALLPGFTISSLRANGLRGSTARPWWCAAAGLVALATATLGATDPAMALLGSYWRRCGVVELAAIVLTGFLMGTWLRAREANRIGLLRVLTVTTALASAYGMAQYFGLDPWLPASAYLSGEGPFTIVRPPGTFGHADYFANWLSGACFCSLALSHDHDQKWWRIAAIGTVALGVIALLLTGTRGALVGLSIGLVLLAFIDHDSQRRRRLLLATLIAALAASAFFFSPAGEKLRARAHWVGEDTWGGARLLLWKDSLHLIEARPLLGFGADQFSLTFPRVQSIELSRAYPDFHHESPHNAALDVLTSSGLAGLSCWIAFLGLVFVRAFRARRSSPLVNPLLAALAALLASHLFAVFTIPTALLAIQLCALLLAAEVPLPPPAVIESRARRLLLLPLSIALAITAVVYVTADLRQAAAMASIQAGALPPSSDATPVLPGPDGSLLIADAVLSRLPSLAPADRLPAWRRALEASTRAAATGDDRANAWYQSAQIFALAGQQENVDRSLRNAITWSPHWFKPHWVLAQSLARQNRWPEALVYARVAQQLNAGHDPEVSATLRSIEATLSPKP